MADEILYPDLKPWELEPHYSRHVSAMTAEALHSKADIAAQLAWRDKTIAELRSELDIRTQELANVESVMGVQREHAREEIAGLKAELAKQQSGLTR